MHLDLWMSYLLNSMVTSRSNILICCCIILYQSLKKFLLQIKLVLVS